jgi:hypothetical protein
MSEEDKGMKAFRYNKEKEKGKKKSLKHSPE